MALTSKKYEKFYETTGSGADKIDDKKLTNVTNAWAGEKAEGCQKYLDDPVMAPLIYQLQQMQDELDYLRTEIDTNKGKSTFPGFGTNNSTALVGDTKLVGIGTNTTLSFGDLTETTVKGTTTYSITLTATRNFGGKTGSQTKSITLTLT
tara:strand:+ start:8847 stop:9296 length:450 start_codon:yes stop_codon:yes gene_type:complete